MTLSTSEELLAKLGAAGPGHDQILQKLIDITDLRSFSLGVEISVILGGSVVRGKLLSPLRLAKRMDAALNEGIENAIARLADGLELEAAEAWRDATKGVFARAIERHTEAEAELNEELEAVAKAKGVERIPDIKTADLSDEQALEAIQLHGDRAAFGLENAVLMVPPALHEVDVGTMRVQISQVEGWWLNGISDEDPPAPDPSA